MEQGESCTYPIFAPPAPAFPSARAVSFPPANRAVSFALAVRKMQNTARSRSGSGGFGFYAQFHQVFVERTGVTPSAFEKKPEPENEKQTPGRT